MGPAEIIAPPQALIHSPLDVLAVTLARVRQAITLSVQSGLGGATGAVAAGP